MPGGSACSSPPAHRRPLGRAESSGGRAAASAPTRGAVRVCAPAIRASEATPGGDRNEWDVTSDVRPASHHGQLSTHRDGPGRTGVSPREVGARNGGQRGPIRRTPRSVGTSASTKARVCCIPQGTPGAGSAGPDFLDSGFGSSEPWSCLSWQVVSRHGAPSVGKVYGVEGLD